MIIFKVVNSKYQKLLIKIIIKLTFNKLKSDKAIMAGIITNNNSQHNLIGPLITSYIIMDSFKVNNFIMNMLKQFKDNLVVDWFWL